MRILLLHAYSAHNRGDGLLVDESVALIRSVFDDVELEVVASDPDSFDYLGVPVYNAKPGRRGWSREYLRVLRNLDSYDLLGGVGGGYLRAGKPVEMLKCLLVMGPQIFAAGRSSTRSVYLPQSIGPFRFGSVHLFRALVKCIGVYMLRDDRSMQEIALANCVRLPDLAISSPEFTDSLSSSDSSVDDTVIFTTRAVGGELPPRVKELGRLLHAANIPVVGYVQSAIGGNNDTEVQRELTGDNSISSEEYLRQGDYPRRVVVAVRLHAALMALKAGHYVIHLAYERKGFSAFEDVGLPDWVHNVNTFTPTEVRAQVEALLHDESVRAEYRRRLAEQREALEQKYARMSEILREQ